MHQRMVAFVNYFLWRPETMGINIAPDLQSLAVTNSSLKNEITMAFELIWESHGLYKRFWDFVTVAELIESVAKPRGDPRFDGIFYVIYDFLAVEGHEVAENAMAGIVAISGGGQAVNPNVVIAVLTTRDEIKDLAWVFASRTLASYPTRIFSSLVHARDWIERAPFPKNRNLFPVRANVLLGD